MSAPVAKSTFTGANKRGARSRGSFRELCLRNFFTSGAPKILKKGGLQASAPAFVLQNIESREFRGKILILLHLARFLFALGDENFSLKNA